MTTRYLIDTLEAFDIAGSTQWVLLRGDPRARRVLLIVQQGPGLPLIHEATAIEQRLRLESRCVVAYWDQRGTGKSWDADPGAISLARLVADVRAMVDALCALLHVDRVDILGLSLGATLATMAAAQNPERIGRVVAVGIDVDFAESERCAYDFARAEAARRGDRRAQRQLEAIGAPPHDTSKRFLTRVRWVTEYGGIDRSRGLFGLLRASLWMLLSSPHYSLLEAVRAMRAMETTQERMLAHLQHFDLRALVSRVEIPIAFFQGRHDRATPPDLVARYVDTLQAPRGKSLVWFEDSAHMPHYEEPARFRSALLRALDVAPALVETRGIERQNGGAALARALGVFVFDNVLIGLAALVIRCLVREVPSLSVIEIGIAVAAGLYWLPPLRRASFALVRRWRLRRAPERWRSARLGG